MRAAGTGAGAAALGRGVAASLLWLLAGAARAEPPALPPHAEAARLAAQSLLVAIGTAGTRLVAVGDRGTVVYSDDQGKSWTQAADVPTQSLLTGVCFFDAQHGVAVGHDEVIVTSADAGRTWKLTHYAPEAQRPLLDVACVTGRGAIAVGAYSTYLTSDDAGASWHENKFTPAPPPRPQAAPHALAASPAEPSAPAGGYHLNRIVPAGNARLYIAAEAGHLYRSDDGGAHWIELPSPYEGSFFGVQPIGGDVVLAYGLRGNLFRSEDAGGTWRRIDTGTLATLDGAARLGSSGVAVVGLSGVVLVSRDAGQSFAPLEQSDRAGLSAAVSLGEAVLAAVGEDGARVIALQSAPAGSGQVH